MPGAQKEPDKLGINIKFEGKLYEKLKQLMEFYAIDTGKDIIKFLVAKDYREIFETGDRADDELFKATMKEVDELIEKKLREAIKKS